MYLLGYDIGSSSIKAALVEVSTGKTISLVSYPSSEMEIISHQDGWAEQHPEVWWESVVKASKEVIKLSKIDPSKILSIGIAYQMHGLVLLDKQHEVLRPSIIWCDSRAVEVGAKALEDLGENQCFSNYLNAPGNFTASKLKWVKDHEPKVYEQIHKIMLPGDFIAYKMSGEICTTVSGLSEGILWDFKKNDLASTLLDYYNIENDLLPDIVDTFSIQGKLTEKAAKQLGLNQGTPISYRAGDQPNNALSLGVFKPGQVAATGGTSGVVYAVTDKLVGDQNSRINSFAHVNHTSNDPSIGLLLCINGAGIQYAWMKNQIGAEGLEYKDMEGMINNIPVGSDGLRIIPFGNGAERILGNKSPGAQINNLQLNRHTKEHFFRAGLEGIAFSFIMGIKILEGMGSKIKHIRVGNDNLFQSEIFSTTIANLLSCPITVVQTTGAIGAAKASGIATKVYASLEEAFEKSIIEKEYIPTNTNGNYEDAYNAWKKDLNNLLMK